MAKLVRVTSDGRIILLDERVFRIKPEDMEQVVRWTPGANVTVSDGSPNPEYSKLLMCGDCSVHGAETVGDVHFKPRHP